MKENQVKRKLKAGGLCFGTMLFEFNTPGIAAIIDQTGAEFVVYDMEHSGFGIETIRQMLSYNRGLNVMPFVRVPDTKYAYMARALDAGAKGIMIPLVESREQVQRIIDACKYAPIGKRGGGFGLAHDDFISGDLAEKIQQINEETLLIVMIESVKALDNIEEIVSTKEIDVVLVGHNDLSISMGIPGQTNHPRIIAAMERVAEACAKYGKTAGCNVMNVESGVTWINKGYRFVAYSGDVWLLQNALSSGIAEIKSRL